MEDSKVASVGNISLVYLKDVKSFPLDIDRNKKIAYNLCLVRKHPFKVLLAFHFLNKNLRTIYRKHGKEAHFVRIALLTGGFELYTGSFIQVGDKKNVDI